MKDLKEKFEELLKDTDWYGVVSLEDLVVEKMQQAYDMGKNDGWVSVEDALPNDTKPFLCLVNTANKNGYYEAICQYTIGGELEFDSEDDDFYDEIRDACFMPKGWYESCEQSGGSYDYVFIKRDVAFWMPLPAKPSPPKTK